MKLALAAARVAVENRGRDAVVLDLRSQTSLFDFFVIVTGTSGRQLHAMSEEIDRVLSEEFGQRRLSLEGYQSGGWILMDYGDVVVHLFEGETRSYYDLEQLWAGASRVPLPAEITAAGTA
ncbi:MAG: ribosome silencing factor [Pirellulales bacterium]|nr:ribosome silencing factor [Pirellulales bacterium]